MTNDAKIHTAKGGGGEWASDEGQGWPREVYQKYTIYITIHISCSGQRCAQCKNAQTEREQVTKATVQRAQLRDTLLPICDKNNNYSEHLTRVIVIF